MKILSLMILSIFIMLLSGCTPKYGKIDRSPYDIKACKKALLHGHELQKVRIDTIIVYKKKRQLKTFSKGKHLHTFRISLGKNGDKGHKVKQGDYRTPEGKYRIVRKKCDRRLYKSLMISYPNKTDRARARKQGLNPGGYITIHGQPKWNADGRGDDFTLASDWTEGCIAVGNHTMDSLWSAVSNGARIEIYR